MPVFLANFIKAFIPLFVAIDPIGLAAVFLAMSVGVPLARRKTIANQAAWTGGLVALGFLFLGQSVFTALGITVSDFQIAGGLILFILAARDLMHSAAEEPVKLADDFGVVPLGMPLIAGPASAPDDRQKGVLRVTGRGVVRGTAGGRSGVVVTAGLWESQNGARRYQRRPHLLRG